MAIYIGTMTTEPNIGEIIIGSNNINLVYVGDELIWPSKKSNGVDFGDDFDIIWDESNVGADNPWEFGLYFRFGDPLGYSPKHDDRGFGSEGTVFNILEGELLFRVDDCDYWIPNDDHITCIHPTGGITDEGLYPTYEAIVDCFKRSKYDWWSLRIHMYDDGATITKNGLWRLPTIAEYQQLFEKCDVSLTVMNGVAGHLLTLKTDSSKQLFFPTAGMHKNGLYYGSLSYYYTSLMAPYPSFFSVPTSGGNVTEDRYHQLESYLRPYPGITLFKGSLSGCELVSLDATYGYISLPYWVGLPLRAVKTKGSIEDWPNILDEVLKNGVFLVDSNGRYNTRTNFIKYAILDMKAILVNFGDIKCLIDINILLMTQGYYPRTKPTNCSIVNNLSDAANYTNGLEDTKIIYENTSSSYLDRTVAYKAYSTKFLNKQGYLPSSGELSSIITLSVVFNEVLQCLLLGNLRNYTNNPTNNIFFYSSTWRANNLVWVCDRSGLISSTSTTYMTMVPGANWPIGLIFYKI